jgi:hypothetical protein
VPSETLTLRQLNRATLARQMLLARKRVTPVKAVEQLLGLQAQLPRPPMVGLWSRLERLEREDVVRQLLDRRIVRATTMRATLHLLSAADYLRFRGPLQAALDRAMPKQRADGLDFDHLVDVGRSFFSTPRTFDAFRDHLETRHPKADVRAMAYAVRTRLPLVMVPTKSPWGFPVQAEFVVADTWLGNAPSDVRTTDALVLRYLEAFGPATVADMQAWSGLQGLKAVMEALRPKLHTFKGEGRTELFDLPDAPRPAEDTPVPVRFLPEWDNIIVSRSDARLLAPAHRPAVFRPGLRVLATVLVDGMVAGIWKTERKAAAATLIVEPFTPLPKRVRAEIEEEGQALLRFVEPDAPRAVVLVR